MTTIEVERLMKTYQVPLRGEGLRAALRSLTSRTVREIEAVNDVSFALEAGETVGFIGPNGAGKTTTLKVLCGILTPTAGDVRVLGHRPWDREPRFLRQIALIRGSQPIGGPPELTVMDALRLQQLVYEVDDAAFAHNLGQLADMLSLGPLLDRQIRALSLGERMRCGLAIALLYRPRVLFLDEPTIGMDVSVVEQTRRFIREYTAETGATTLLTSHYMADVEQLCPRIILINGGVVAFDGPLARLTALHAGHHHITVTVENASTVDWTRFGDLVAVDAGQARLRAPRDRIPAIARDLLAALPVLDLGIEEEPLETVIDRVYRQGLERREDVVCAG